MKNTHTKKDEEGREKSQDFVYFVHCSCGASKSFCLEARKDIDNIMRNYPPARNWADTHRLTHVRPFAQ